MTSKLKTDVLETGSGSGTIALNNQFSGMTSASMPAGSVLQVVSVNETAASAHTLNASSSEVMTLSITPTSATSKILVTACINCSASMRYTLINITRGGSNIIEGDSVGSRGTGTAMIPEEIDTNTMYMVHPVTVSYLDSPSTASAVSYGINFYNYASMTAYLNRNRSDTDAVYQNRTVSTLTLTEIKG